MYELHLRQISNYTFCNFYVTSQYSSCIGISPIVTVHDISQISKKETVLLKLHFINILTVTHQCKWSMAISFYHLFISLLLMLSSHLIRLGYISSIIPILFVEPDDGIIHTHMHAHKYACTHTTHTHTHLHRHTRKDIQQTAWVIQVWAW